jgi:hypothetical protein
MAQLSVGTRVDCLFDGLEYYRGSIASCNADGTFGIAFDDGDVLEAAPASHVLVLLPVGSRVECWFESAEEYFSGGIAADNGDATYQVHFDDGDELAAAPRRDIKLVTGNLSCSAPSPVRISNQLDSLCDGLQGFSAAATESPITQQASGKGYSAAADDSDADAAAPYEDDAFERIVQAQTVTGTQRAKRAFGKLARSKESAPTAAADSTTAAGENSAPAAAAETKCPIQHCDPGVYSALYSHLDALRHSPEQLALVPPDYRLFVLLTQVDMFGHGVFVRCTVERRSISQYCDAAVLILWLQESLMTDFAAVMKYNESIQHCCLTLQTANTTYRIWPHQLLLTCVCYMCAVL